MNMQRDFFANSPDTRAVIGHIDDTDTAGEGIMSVDDIENIGVVEKSKGITGKLPVRDANECLDNINELRKKYPFKMTIHCRCVRPYNHCSFVSSHPGREPMSDVRIGKDRVLLYPDYCIDGTLGSDFHPDMVTKNDIVVEVGGRPCKNDFSPFEVENKSRAVSGKAVDFRTKPLASLLMRNKIRQVHSHGQLKHNMCGGR